MKIPINFGAGGGSGSDDCTAEAADVLAGKTAIYKGTDDEPVAGTMADYSGTTTSAALSQDSTNSRVLLTVPNTGKYDTAAKLYTSFSQMRTLIGYTDASKVLSGTTFLGLAGTMADKSGTTSSATSSLDSSNSRLRLQIPSNGYYNTSAYLYQTYSNIASLIGLTAAKIKYGESILGITGTWNGYVATATDIYYGGSVGSLCGSLSTYTASGATATAQSACVLLSTLNQTATLAYASMGFSTALICSGYSKITITYNVTNATTGSNSYAYLCLYSSRPTSASGFAIGNATYYTALSTTSTGSSKTASIDISGTSQSLYVGAFLYTQTANANYEGTIEVTRIQVS